MTEQLISFETAKLAHEKGFRHRSDFMYDRNNEIQNTPSIKHLVNSGEIKEIARPTQIFAPTQSLLQKWLREKHEIFVQVTWEPIIHYYYCRIDTWNNSPKYVLYFSDGASAPEFYSYEEALEQGLLEALKLIK